MKQFAIILTALGLPVLVAACTTTGTGVGYERSGGLRATFAWTSDDSVHGTMNATLSNGDIYTGPFFQITRETRLESLAPLWSGWETRGNWRGWPGWGPSMTTATTYSPRVLANLQKASGERMRCRFTLARPASGMAGGGEGRCQLADGTVIFADFSRN